MTPETIAQLRKQLGLSQLQFAQLFGVHPMTISRWERGTLVPTPYQTALMEEFQQAAKKKTLGGTLASVLVGAGVVAALWLLLNAARGK